MVITSFNTTLALMDMHTRQRITQTESAQMDTERERTGERIQNSNTEVRRGNRMTGDDKKWEGRQRNTDLILAFT